MYWLSVDDLYKDECIMMRCKTVRLKTDAYVMILDVLNQFIFKKLSSKLRTNCQKLYKVCVDVFRLLIILSACVLRTSV